MLPSPCLELHDGGHTGLRFVGFMGIPGRRAAHAERHWIEHPSRMAVMALAAALARVSVTHIMGMSSDAGSTPITLDLDRHYRRPFTVRARRQRGPQNRTT